MRYLPTRWRRVLKSSHGVAGQALEMRRVNPARQTCCRHGARPWACSLAMRSTLSAAPSRSTTTRPTTRAPGPWTRASRKPSAVGVAIRGAEKGDLLFVDEAGLPLQNDKLAELVRAHLLAAGVSREELHKPGENRGQSRLPRPPVDVRDHLAGQRQDRDLGAGPDRPHDQRHDQPLSKGRAVCYRAASRRATTARRGHPRPRKSRPGGPKGGPSTSGLDQRNRRNYRERLSKPKWRNWQTRRTQNPFPEMECRFKSDLRHYPESFRIPTTEAP